MEGLSADHLRQLAIFGGLTDDVLGRLAHDLRVLPLNAGTVVFREEEPAREMYGVLGGELEVTKKSRRGSESRIALIGPGECFGEMSLIDIQPRSATVRAISPSLLLRLGADDLDQLYRTDLKSYALIVLNVARDLSRRLRVTDALVADFMVSVWDTYLNGQKKAR